MEVQEILSGKKKLLEYLKEKGFQEEKDYPDDEYEKGFYFKIDKKKLLVIYEIFEEEKIKETKDHFLIDRGLSYCIIILDGKLIFFRNFGETKHFIYSERTKNNISKIDKLKNIEALDSLFQSKDISALFYEAFKVKRNLLVQNIKNDVEPVQKYLIAQKIFDRFFFIYFLCHKGIIKFRDGGKISGDNLFTKILLKKGKFLENLKKFFHLFNSQGKNILEIGDYQIVIPYLNGGLFRPDVLEQDLDITLKDEQWEEIFEFLNSYHWIIEDVKATEENEEKILTPEILGHVYERSVVEWETEGFEKEAENVVKKISERKKKGVYYTPESITDYISNNTIIPYLLDKLENKYTSFDKLIGSKNKKDIEEAIKILDEIKVLDPACGSGAFLIKASEVIFCLKRRLNYEIKRHKNFYDLKLDIITENIYGVDILSGATEISKLRLWLWLISDYEESRNEIKALPNIEYNLKVGNSLIGWIDEKLQQKPMKTPLTEKVDGIFIGLIAFSDDTDGEDLKKARELLKTYKLNDYTEAYYNLYKIYRRTHGSKAENLRNILETIRKSIYSTVTPAFLDYINKKIDPKYTEILKSKKISSKVKKKGIIYNDFSSMDPFHWGIDFGHIIRNGGFDVVIGNPPYLSFSSSKTLKNKDLNKLFYKLFGKYKDLYEYFVLHSNRLSGKYIDLIVPNNIVLSPVINKITNNIVSFDNIGEGIFEGANTSVCVIKFDKSKVEKGFYFSDYLYKKGKLDKIGKISKINIPNFNFNEDNQLVKIIERSSTSIGSLGAKITRGEEIGRNVLINKNTGNVIPIFTATDAAPFLLKPPKYFIDPKKIEKKFYNKNKVGVTITFRKKIKGSYLGKSVTLKSIISIYNINNTQMNNILALLNSRLFNYYHYLKYSFFFEKRFNRIEDIYKYPYINFSKVVSDIVEFLIKKYSKDLHNILDYIIFEEVFKNELNTNLLTIIKNVKDIRNLTSNKEVLNEIEKIRENYLVKIIEENEKVISNGWDSKL